MIRSFFRSTYSRMWGCHHAGMWVYRLGLARVIRP
jgi:hypothetical protein